MDKITRLLKSYNNFIQIPWREVAPAQRVIFCVYNQNDELKLRFRIDEFDIATQKLGYKWCLFDLTDTFAEWIIKQKYKDKYFQNPNLIEIILLKYFEYIIQKFESFIKEKKINKNYVVAISGVGSLFGFLKVKDVVEKISPFVKGRLLIFFPGSYENNNYRLMDGYDGWNYLAIPITADKE